MSTWYKMALRNIHLNSCEADLKILRYVEIGMLDKYPISTIQLINNIKRRQSKRQAQWNR